MSNKLLPYHIETFQPYFIFVYYYIDITEEFTIKRYINIITSQIHHYLYFYIL